MIMYWKTKLKLLLLLSSFLCYPAISKGCTTTAPLGLSNGLIRNYQITASSYLSTDIGDFSPSQARLGIRNCWCGNYAGKGNWKDDWLQITFEKPTILKAIATQGNPDNIASFVKKFSLEFSDNGNVFYPLNDTSGKQKEFVGNEDNNGVKLNPVSAAFSTRFVRFRAKEINNSYDGSVCLRMELYGCQAAKDANYGQSMFPLGTETGAIQDSALSASSELSGKEAKLARLNNAAGWCASSTSPQWLQVDLGRLYMVNAIATQGFGAKNSNEMVASYQISYSVNSTNFVSIEDLPGRVKTFSGNTESNQEPVIGVLSEPVRAKIIRIIPKTKGLKSSMYCMRVELFGHVEKCYKSITARPGLTFSSSTTKTGKTHQNAFLFSNNVWCANVNDASQFIKIEFGTALQVSGIAIQGDIQHSSSVSMFKIKYKPPCGTEAELATTFNAIYDKHRVSRHWFTSSIKTEYITITPVTWSNNICLRFHIFGCPDSLKRVPLGMRSGFISSNQMTASSTYNSNDVKYKPGQARLDIQSRWCGSKTGTDLVNDYHQVDFGKMIVLNGIATQGDPNDARNYVKKFYLEIGNTSTTFVPIKRCSNNHEFAGNVDATNIKYNYFDTGVVTRYVRFRATKVGRTDANRHVCVRLEYYGTAIDGPPASVSKVLYPLGMENGIISDSQLSADFEYNSNPAKNGRMRLSSSGWCPGTANDGWLKIVFPKFMSITAVALQGHGDPGSPDRTYKYYIQYKQGFTWTNIKNSNGVDQLFIGNKDTQNDPVMALLPSPLSVKMFRINPYELGTGSSVYCLRAEFYGYRTDCSDDLTLSSNTLISGSSFSSMDLAPVSHIYNPISWCADSSDVNPFLIVNLGSPKRITGFGVQGDSNGDNWPTKVKVSHGNQLCCLTEINTEFIGNSDRNRVARHWFTSDIVAQFLKIRIHAKNGNACMRVQVLGCDAGSGRAPLGMGNGLIADSQITATSRYSSGQIKWKASTARLRVTGNRWCSHEPYVTGDYLQVDFKRVVTLTGIASQGDDSWTSNFVKKFYLQVSLEGSSFHNILDELRNRKDFIGNSDNTGIVYNWLPVPTKARYVRFRASDVSGNSICLRLEYYGSFDDEAAGKSLFPLGLESGVIKDEQISDSGDYNSNPARFGRFRGGKGWCANAGNNEWMQIDLKQPMVITAVATQGHGDPNSPDRTYEYYLKYSYNQSNTYEFVKDSTNIKKLFKGNKEFQNVPALNLLPVPVTARFIRINPRSLGTRSNHRCLRAEIFGYHPDCSDDLTNLIACQITASSSKRVNTAYTAKVNSDFSWCPTSKATTEYIEVNLGHLHRVTGVGIQGDSENDFWPKTFKISHGKYKGCLSEMSEEFIANKDRNGVTRHWFSGKIIAQFIRFRVISFNGAGPVCLRIQVLGCKKIIKEPKVNKGRSPLGMGNGFIADSQITATSRYGAPRNDWRGYTARLRVTGGRWCSKQPLNYSDYLQVDFQRDVTLTGVATQGDDNHNTNYVKVLYLEVSSDGVNYQVVQDACGLRENFTANTNNNGIVYNWLSVPTKARKMRFRASDVSGTHICARIELYGSSDDRAAGKSLFPLGLESGVIKDSQISESGNFDTNPARLGRFRGNKGWCANSGNDEWMQIDLKQPMVITAVATQGHGGHKSPDRTYEYYLKYSNNQSSTFEFVKDSTKKLFKGNKEFQNVPALNLLPVPVTAQFIRINPITEGTGSTHRCLRAEIFGYHPVCNDDLTTNSAITASSSLIGNPARNVHVYSPNTWCATSADSNGYIDVILSQARVVSGVGIQGDSNAENWIKTFKISHAVKSGSFKEISNVFTGSNDRNSVVRNWLLPPVFAKYLRIKADTFQTKLCARVQILGCSTDYDVISSFSVTVVNMRLIRVNWGLIHSTSPSFTLQYRKIGASSWTEKKNIATNTTTIIPSEKYKTFEARLISAKGILMLDRIVTGGSSFLDSVKFHFKKAPTTVLSSVSAGKKGVKTIKVDWGKTTTTENFDWDLKGVSILIKCAGDPRTKSCTTFSPKEVNVTNLNLGSSLVSGLELWTNYTVQVQVYNGWDRGPFSSKVTIVTAEGAPSIAPKISSITAKKTSLELNIEGYPKDKANGELVGYHVLFRCIQTDKTRDCSDVTEKNNTILDASKLMIIISSLPTWTRYEVRIQVYNRAGSSPVSVATTTTTLETAPSAAPSGVKAKVINATCIEITWKLLKKDDTNGVLKKYVVILNSSRDSSTKTIDVLNNWGRFNVTGLKPFTNYRVEVAAVNSIGSGPKSDKVTVQTMEAAPSKAPSIELFAAEKFAANFTVKNINEEDENGIIIGYKISFKCVETQTTRNCSNSDVTVKDISASKVTEFRLTKLKSWTRYSVRVQVSTKAGISPFSSELLFSTLEEVPRLPPRHITMKTVSSRSLLLEWKHLKWDDTNGIISGYSIAIINNGSPEKLRNASGSSKSYKFLGLHPYTNYTVRIAAVNKAGRGPYSNGLTQLTFEEAPSEAPIITSVKPFTKSAELRIQNIEKSFENGKMLGYFVGYRCITSDKTRDCPDPSKRNITVKGYPKDTIKIIQLYSWMKYGITLQAYNKAGASQRSNEIINTTKEDKPSAPPNNIAVAVSGSRGLKITWKPLAKNDTNGIITSYHVVLEFTRRGVKENRERFTADTNLNLDTLYPYTIYTVTVAAENSAGIGKYSNGLQNRTEQDAPSAPSITDALPKGTTEVLIKWNPPLDMNGIITKYELCYYLASASNCTIRVLPSNQTEALARNLETHVNYTFKIRAFTIKAGNWSDVVIQKTEIGVPTAPLNPQISGLQSTSLRLSWTKPEKPRGILISYKIKLTGRKAYNSSFLHSSIVEGNCNDPCTSRLLSGLVPGTSYTFSVAVATSADLGPYSVEVSGITLVAGPPKPMFNVISSYKEGGTERNITINSVTNVNGPIISYQVIVERKTSSVSSPMINFPELLLKTEAEEKSLNYYLAKSTLPDQTPFLLRFKPGISYVEAFGSDLETPGNYYLHFRAVTQAYLKPKSKKVYGEASVYKLERKFMNKLPEPASKDISAYTIQLQLTLALPKAFTPSYYYVIAIELVSGTSPQDPSTYQPQDLKKYDPVTTKPGTPYIAAVISSSDFSKSKQFILGDGKTTSTSSLRRKRQARAVKDEYVNSALKPDKVYSVFIRAVSASSTYYSTPWTSELRTKAAPKTTTESSGQGGAIAAGVTVSLLVVIAGVALGFYFRRRRLMYGKPTESTEYLDEIEVKDLKRPKPPPAPEAAFAITEVDGVPYEPVNLKITKNPAYPSFPAKNIVQVFRRKCALEDAGFKEEFESLPQGQLFTWNIGCQIDNKPRNRFANIIAYDYSRVKLVNSQDESDYINASYVVDYNGRPRYIASQAPVVKTVPNFWTMIWEQEIPAIVMLTKCVEGNKRKSEEYWPTSGSEQYGNIKVSFLGAEEFPEYTIATMELEFGKSRRTFKHFHYLTWPDHGVPTYPTALLSFRRRLRQAFPFDSQTEKPIVVHCSAGVGRTGAFIAIDTLIHLIHKQRIVDVFSFVRVLRLQRPQMVQRWAQFKFIYDCLLEAAVCGVTEISTQEFRQRYNHLSNADQNTGNDGFHKEFACLSFVATEIEEEEFSSAKQSCITHKNRDPTVLPRNTQRVFLPAIEFTEGCNYINAVYVDGNDKDQFIATQAPLETTIGDFWRMVVDRDSSTVISLVNDDEVFPRYWPKTNEASYDNGNIKVNLQETQKITENLTKRTFITTDNMFNRTSNDIHVFNLNEWPDHSVPESVMSLVQLIDEAERTQRSLGGGPIIVHCSTGGGRTGTFIAAYTILERLKDEQMIDVFQVVRRIRKTRPKFVENKEQYKLLYDVVACYLEQFSTYSNF